MTTHIMVDIETLGTRLGAVVLSAAFVRFTDEAHMSVNLSVPDQEMIGLEKDESTLEWWRIQDTRTFYNLAGINAKDFAVPPPHVALNDAIGQTRAAKAAMAILARAHEVVA